MQFDFRKLACEAMNRQSRIFQSSVILYMFAPQVTLGLLFSSPAQPGFVSRRWPSVTTNRILSIFRSPGPVSGPCSFNHRRTIKFTAARSASIQEGNGVDPIQVEAYCPDPKCPRITSIFPMVPTTPLPPLIFHIKTSKNWDSLSELLVEAIQVRKVSAS
jgi:hypothetical protein